MPITHTVVYTLTSGANVVFDRTITAGDIITALPLYALVVAAALYFVLDLVRAER